MNRKTLGVGIILATCLLLVACTTWMYREGKEYRVPYQQKECTCVHVDGD